MRVHQTEDHRVHRSGWLRAAVLGANDGIVSTASLILGVAAAEATREDVLLAGIAGLVAGAMSMAAGEYVSVKSQADTEAADLLLEEKELANHPEAEEEELRDIYIARGLDKSLATEVARQMTRHDALGAHARDEIGISDALSARPLQAAVASAWTFALGASVPVLLVALLGVQDVLWVIPLTAVALLGVLGALAARAGGASARRGAVRVCFWGTLAMGLTYLVGVLVEIAI